MDIEFLKHAAKLRAYCVWAAKKLTANLFETRQATTDPANDFQLRGAEYAESIIAYRSDGFCRESNCSAGLSFFCLYVSFVLQNAGIRGDEVEFQPTQRNSVAYDRPCFLVRNEGNPVQLSSSRRVLVLDPKPVFVSADESMLA